MLFDYWEGKEQSLVTAVADFGYGDVSASTLIIIRMQAAAMGSLATATRAGAPVLVAGLYL